MDQELQEKARKHVSECFETSKRLMEARRAELLDVYEEVSTFKMKDGSFPTDFKVNKAHEVVEKTTAQLMANNPKWVVTPRRRDAFSSKMVDNLGEITEAISDYLTYCWDEYNLDEPCRLFLKAGVKFGKGYAKIRFKEENYGKFKGERPDIEVRSWTNVYYDPRFVRIEDRPYFIELDEGVRYSDLVKQKDRYMNLDKLYECKKGENENVESYKRRIQSIAGIPTNEKIDIKVVDLGYLDIKKYYGIFSEKEEEEEGLYEIWTVQDLFVIYFEKVSQNPFEEWKCFEDTDTAFAVGIVEPIMGLLKEQNFKKNAAAEYINRALVRQVVWSPDSGISPESINDPVIVTTRRVDEAMSNFRELQHTPIDSAYFAEQNDFERQIQSATFSVDTANPRNEQALTNTATGARIKFYESNVVRSEIRKHFEKALERLAYKLLQATFENVSKNIVFVKTGTKEQIELNKEIFKDAIARYSIRVEVNSSADDYIESRRSEQLALYNTLLAAKGQGESVNIQPALQDLLDTYEVGDPSKYFAVQDFSAVANEITGGQPLTPQKSIPPAQTSKAEQITNNIAGQL